MQISVSSREKQTGARRELAPVGRRTLHESVHEELRQALFDGTLLPGQVLGIVDLAQSLGTSTMPVREALNRLVAERALEALPNRSVRVPVITPARLDDVLRARLLVEGSAVELAVHRFTAADRERLAENLARHDAAIHERRAGDVAEETRHNYAFHFLIYRAAASPVLLSIIESLWLQSGPILAAATQAFAASDELSGTKYHHALAAAIAVGDVAAARAALAADIGRAFDILRTQFAEGAGP